MKPPRRSNSQRTRRETDEPSPVDLCFPALPVCLRSFSSFSRCARAALAGDMYEKGLNEPLPVDADVDEEGEADAAKRGALEDDDDENLAFGVDGDSLSS